MYMLRHLRLITFKPEEQMYLLVLVFTYTKLKNQKKVPTTYLIR
jgi:hypothetical protein